MARIGATNLKVAVVDGDFYARNALNAYLAWDRRTRVVGKYARLDVFWAAHVDRTDLEPPDALVLDANQFSGAETLNAAIQRLRAAINGLRVIYLAPSADLDDLFAAAEAGAAAYLLKQDVRIHIAWAICHACALEESEILLSAGLRDSRRKLSHPRLRRAKCLALPRRFVGMTARKRQAIELFAIEGMPQRLVADEMGIAESTVRDYIKQAYRILESYHDDAGDYPADMNRQEIAFMRITALDIADC